MKNNLDDTIAAISTPAGEGGIGIVRLSGRDSLSIADKIFKSKDKKCPSGFKSYTVHYGHIIHCPCSNTQKKDRETIDEVLLTVMRAPKTYTKEDIVEINCHSGIVPLRKILDLVLSCGVRLAEPGEFTKRAFLNGRIDLIQAESVLDIIKSKTDAALRAAMSQLEGDFSKNIKELRQELLDLLGHVEVSIDFPEEDIEILSDCLLFKRIESVKNKIRSFIDTVERGRILTEGMRTVICGKTNVGKSSLMNSLLKEKRVIVSHIPGTTRDAIEEMINIDGVPLIVTDTAGIMDTDCVLTKEGMKRSHFYIESAGLVLLVLDGSEPLTSDDRAIIEKIRDREIIVIINKTDLPEKIKINEIKKILPNKKIVKISATKKENLEILEKTISQMIWGGEVMAGDALMVTSVRHKNLLIQAEHALCKILTGSKEKILPELTAIDLKEAINALGGITGETIDSNMLDRIFEKFCIGK